MTSSEIKKKTDKFLSLTRGTVTVSESLSEIFIF